MTPTTDADLLRVYATSRNADVFAEIVRRYAAMVYTTARRLTGSDADAQDVTQTCFLELCSKAASIHTSTAAWLHAAATFRATDLIRKRDVRRHHEQQAATLPQNQTASDPTWAEIEPLIDQAIAALPDKLREPLVLHYLQGQSQTEAAARLGINQSTISRRLERAVAALRTSLGTALPATALATLLIDHVSAHPAPAALLQSLGKMAAAGPAPAVSASANLSLVLTTSLLLIAGGIAILAFWLKGASGTSPTTQGSAMSNPITPTPAQHSGNSVVIAGVPPLHWGKSGETTFCGALSAALAPSDRPRSYSTLMGESALAFRARWYRTDAQNRLTGAAPIGEQAEERQRISAALGVPMDAAWDAGKQKQRIVRSIDAGRPVLAYLSPHLDMGVVYGYADQGNAVLVHDYYDGDDNQHSHPYDKLGDFFIFLDGAYTTPAAPRDAFLTALHAAGENWWRTDHPKFDETGTFAYGELAYDQWLEDLRSVDQWPPERREQLFDVSNWALNCLNDARWAAVKYLRDSAPMFDGDARQNLLIAASLYERAAKASGGPTWGEKAVFLGPWSGKTIANWTPAVRAREIAILQQCRLLDRSAISRLIKVVTTDQPFVAEANSTFTAFCGALKLGDDVECEKLLRAHPELARQVDWNTSPGVTALHWACWFDRVHVIDLLLDAGADPNALDACNLVTPMEWAHFHGQPAAMQRMEQRGARIDMRMAARFNRIDLVRKLLAIPGVDINAIGSDDYEGSVSLATLNNNPGILKLLLEAGADVHVANAGLNTPLHQAAEGSHVGCARLLLQFGAEVNARNLAGKTPLDLAMMRGDAGMIQLLLEHGGKTASPATSR